MRPKITQKNNKGITLIAFSSNNNSGLLEIIKVILTDQKNKYENIDTFKTTMKDDYKEMVESVKTWRGRNYSSSVLPYKDSYYDPIFGVNYDSSRPTIHKKSETNM